MTVRLWCPYNKSWDFAQVDVSSNPIDGPEDELIKVRNHSVKPDKKGEFVDRKYTDEEIDAIHAFACAKLTIELWEKYCKRKINWPWGSNSPNEKLNIVLYNNWIDASYQIHNNSILFGKTNNDTQYFCRSLDLVAHETSHAIIESLRPGIHESCGKDGMAVIEAIADLSAFFLKISNPEISECLAQIKSNSLKQKSMITEFAWGFYHTNYGLRSILNKQSNNRDAYSISRAITHFIYQSIIEIAQHSTIPDNFYPNIERLISATFNTFLICDELNTPTYLKRLKYSLKQWN